MRCWRPNAETGHLMSIWYILNTDFCLFLYSIVSLVCNMLFLKKNSTNSLCTLIFLYVLHAVIWVVPESWEEGCPSSGSWAGWTSMHPHRALYTGGLHCGGHGDVTTALWTCAVAPVAWFRLSLRRLNQVNVEFKVTWASLHDSYLKTKPKQSKTTTMRKNTLNKQQPNFHQNQNIK